MFNQLTGQSFMSEYGAIFIKSLDTMSPFTFKVISSAVTFLGPIITFALVDVIGRRRVYLIWQSNLCLDSGAVTGSKVPGLQLRGKNSMVVYWVQLICGFVVSFTLPYLLEAGYANLQSKGRFIYGGFGLLGLIWAYFYLPDMAGRSLEELEIMRAEKIPARQFRSMFTSHVPPESKIDVVTDEYRMAVSGPRCC
jgi:SP family sugar:H+ symporter-like MFS transporter